MSNVSEGSTLAARQQTFGGASHLFQNLPGVAMSNVSEGSAFSGRQQV
jgi:hypothetical protein